jgi:beta-lactamase regulating signal transducer with metallopeptidase domain
VWLLFRLFRKAPANMRYWVWWLASLQLLVRLVIASPVAVPLLPAKPQAAAPPPIEVGQPEQQIAASVSLEVAPTEQVYVPAKPSAALFLLVVWAVGFGVFSGAGLGRLRRARQLMQDAAPVLDPRVLDTFHDLCRAIPVKSCRLLVSEHAPCPMLSGWFRPAILLPGRNDEALEGPGLRMALAHEISHLRRRDLWFGLVPALSQTILFFHPLAWLASHEASAACEEASDLEAMRVGGGSAASYARLLLDSARSTAPVAAVGAALGFRLLQRRIKMLSSSTTSTGRAYRRASLALVALAAMFTIPWQVTAQALPAALIALPDPAAKHTSKSVHHSKAAHAAKKPKAAHSRVASKASLKSKSNGKSLTLTGASAVGLVAGPSHGRSTTISASAAGPSQVPNVTRWADPAKAIGGGVSGIGSVTKLAEAPAPAGMTLNGRIDAALPVTPGGGFGGGRSSGGGGFGGGGIAQGTGRAIGGGFGGGRSSGGGGLGGGGSVADEGEFTCSKTGPHHVTAHFRNVDITSALAVIFQALDMNYVISPDLRRERVNCGFHDIEVDDAISAILKESKQGLSWHIEANVWHIVRD